MVMIISTGENGAGGWMEKAAECEPTKKAATADDVWMDGWSQVPNSALVVYTVQGGSVGLVLLRVQQQKSSSSRRKSLDQGRH